MDMVVEGVTLPSAMDNSLLLNRSKLLKLAESKLKTRKKPTHKKTINLKEDPSYTNIEHLVFSRHRPSPQKSPTTNGAASSTSVGVRVHVSAAGDVSSPTMKADAPSNAVVLRPDEGSAYYHSLDRTRLLSSPGRDETNVTLVQVDFPSNMSDSTSTSGSTVVQVIHGRTSSGELKDTHRVRTVSRSQQKPPVHLNVSRTQAARPVVQIQASGSRSPRNSSDCNGSDNTHVTVSTEKTRSQVSDLNNDNLLKISDDESYQCSGLKRINRQKCDSDQCDKINNNDTSKNNSNVEPKPLGISQRQSFRTGGTNRSPITRTPVGSIARNSIRGVTSVSSHNKTVVKIQKKEVADATADRAPAVSTGCRTLTRSPSHVTKPNPPPKQSPVPPRLPPRQSSSPKPPPRQSLPDKPPEKRSEMCRVNHKETKAGSRFSDSFVSSGDSSCSSLNVSALTSELTPDSSSSFCSASETQVNSADACKAIIKDGPSPYKYNSETSKSSPGNWNGASGSDTPRTSSPCRTRLESNGSRRATVHPTTNAASRPPSIRRAQSVTAAQTAASKPKSNPVVKETTSSSLRRTSSRSSLSSSRGSLCGSRNSLTNTNKAGSRSSSPSQTKRNGISVSRSNSLRRSSETHSNASLNSEDSTNHAGPSVVSTAQRRSLTFQRSASMRSSTSSASSRSGSDTGTRDNQRSNALLKSSKVPAATRPPLPSRNTTPTPKQPQVKDSSAKTAKTFRQRTSSSGNISAEKKSAELKDEGSSVETPNKTSVVETTCFVETNVGLKIDKNIPKTQKYIEKSSKDCVVIELETGELQHQEKSPSITYESKVTITEADKGPKQENCLENGAVNKRNSISEHSTNSYTKWYDGKTNTNMYCSVLNLDIGQPDPSASSNTINITPKRKESYISVDASCEVIGNRTDTGPLRPKDEDLLEIDISVRDGDSLSQRRRSSGSKVVPSSLDTHSPQTLDVLSLSLKETAVDQVDCEVSYTKHSPADSISEKVAGKLSPARVNSLERPTKPIYTWYEPVKRLNFASPEMQSPVTPPMVPCAKRTPSNNGVLTKLEPKLVLTDDQTPNSVVRNSEPNVPKQRSKSFGSESPVHNQSESKTPGGDGGNNSGGNRRATSLPKSYLLERLGGMKVINPGQGAYPWHKQLLERIEPKPLIPTHLQNGLYPSSGHMGELANLRNNVRKTETVPVLPSDDKCKKPCTSLHSASLASVTDSVIPTNNNNVNGCSPCPAVAPEECSRTRLSSAHLSSSIPSLLPREDGSLSPPLSPTRSADEPRLPSRDKPISKSARRLKASSSPPALSCGLGDLSASDGDLRRPWSQIYTAEEAKRLLEAKSCVLASEENQGSQVDLAVSQYNATPSSPVQHSFPARFSSLRASGTRSPVDNILQKFRKSFSMRFQRGKRPESPPPPSQPSPPTSRADEDGAAEGEDDDDEPMFRIGPIVWRLSKEKRQKTKEKKDSPLKGGKCSSPDSGIQIEVLPNETRHNDLPVAPSPPTSRPPSTPPSPALFHRRGKSSSLRLERQRRPLSDVGGTFRSSVALIGNSMVDVEDIRRSEVRRTQSDLGGVELIQEALRNYHQQQHRYHHQTTPPMVKTRSAKHIPSSGRTRGRLRRSASQPLEIEKLAAVGSISHGHGLSDQEDGLHDLSTASSDEELSSDGENSRILRELYSECATYAEALWDHVTMDSEELPFKAGDRIAVFDCNDREWWWGRIGDKFGWFPAGFVRLRVNQDETLEDSVEKMNNGILKSLGSRKMNVNLLSNDQVRTNVIKEIIDTERDFVKHLKDVIDGYLKQVRKRPDMFPEDRISTIFGNIEQIYNFQSCFLEQLECCMNWTHPHLSEIGTCFVEHREGFEMYSEYCNNHPQAVSELQELFTLPKYSHFFEACRLLQDMIDISLDGFLLTPVQKICKYPLQLAELLKYTKPEHPDYVHVTEALETMRSVAQYINERKRRMECLEKLAAWQLTVEDWEGPDLLENSSELIYSGEVNKLTSAWSRDITLFLFDHQLILCKKDLLKRNVFCYKGRINLDNSKVIDIPDGRDVPSGLTTKNAWKVYCGTRGKWFVFCTKTLEEKEKWMKAFINERKRVSEDKEQGFIVSDKAKQVAMAAVKNKLKRHKSKSEKEFSSGRRMTHVSIVHHPNHPNIKLKTTSLPHGSVLSTRKKKHSAWFSFGSSKKQKR